MQFHHRIEMSARYATSTERGYVTREIESVFDLPQYLKLAPHLKGLIRGHASYPSLKGACEGLDTALRTIRFIDAAEVKESRAWVSLFGDNAGGMRCGVGPSGFDHTQVWNWYGCRLVTTEPYASGIGASLDWGAEHGWQAQPIPEWGMWNPPHTTLILCIPPRQGLSIGVIVRQLECCQPLPLESRQTEGLTTVYPRPLRRAP